MNNSKKRQQSIKNKLFAAVAMLLVATIMMVSTTYAWFTLSTAPEVQGITTTVGANGNLEIALSPLSGNASEITSAVGDANAEWIVKNLTWGNLLDLSDASYGLGEIALLPSQLNIEQSQDATKLNTLKTSPLKVATYGADGRINALSADGVAYGAKKPDATVDGFVMNSGSGDVFGIRAVGTSSTLPQNVLNFQNALAAINSNRGAANGQVTAALNTYGGALTGIAIKYATGATTGYEAYVTDLQKMIDELDGAADKIEVALYNALMAISASNLPIGSTEDGPIYISEVMIEGKSLYDTIKANQAGGIPLTTPWSLLDEYRAFIDIAFPELANSYTGWQSINENVGAAQAAAKALKPTEPVSVDQIKGVLRYLMNISQEGAVTINGVALETLKENPGAAFSEGASGFNLQLNSGSGVFATYGEITGNVSGSAKIPEGTEVGGMPVGNITLNIVTTTEPGNGPLLTQVRTTIAQMGVGQSGGDTTSASVIDTTYGYALDFFFRTNAANSSLLLQSDAAQRVYGDSSNAATMGAGSTLTFDGKLLKLQTLVDMMSGIRVVFTETKGDDVYGIAKVSIDQIPYTLAAKNVITDTDANGKTTFDDGDDATLKVALTVTSDYNAVNTIGWSYGKTAIENKLINVVVEEVYDAVRDVTYERWSVIKVVGDATSGYMLDANNTVESYFHVYDQPIEIEGELSLYEYKVDSKGMLTFDKIKDVQSLTTLDQNVATAITALVYLDGDYIDNSDVVNSENGISNTGVLNLQFASSANLVPMNNATLHNGFGVTLPTVEGLTIKGEAMVAANKDYTFTIGALEGTTCDVYYTVNGGGTETLLEKGTDGYTIPADKVTGNIEIIIKNVVIPEPIETTESSEPAESSDPAESSEPAESSDPAESQEP